MTVFVVTTPSCGHAVRTGNLVSADGALSPAVEMILGAVWMTAEEVEISVLEVQQPFGIAVEDGGLGVDQIGQRQFPVDQPLNFQGGSTVNRSCSHRWLPAAEPRPGIAIVRRKMSGSGYPYNDTCDLSVSIRNLFFRCER